MPQHVLSRTAAKGKAQGEDSVIKLRVPNDYKRRLKRAAEKRKLSLSAFMLAAADEKMNDDGGYIENEATDEEMRQHSFATVMRDWLSDDEDIAEPISGEIWRA